MTRPWLFLLKSVGCEFDVFFVIFYISKRSDNMCFCLKLLTKTQNKKVKYGACLNKNVQKHLTWSKQVTRGLFLLTCNNCLFFTYNFWKYSPKKIKNQINLNLLHVLCVARVLIETTQHTNIIRLMRKFHRTEV